MNEEDYKTYIDFGASKMRIGIFDKNFSNLIFLTEKECFYDFNLKYLNSEETKKILHELIILAEKKIGSYIKNVNLMFDLPNLYSKRTKRCHHHYTLRQSPILFVVLMYNT